jgi:hypothetical protein
MWKTNKGTQNERKVQRNKKKNNTKNEINSKETTKPLGMEEKVSK